MKSFGVVGAGNMGGGMVRRLCDQGWSVHLNDIDAAVVAPLVALGAQSHPSARDVAQACQVLAIVVVDQAQVDAVLEGEQGLLGALTPDHTVLLCPTLSPEDVERTAERIHATGAQLIDAPMSGGPARAAQGQMSLMVACPNACLAQHEALLKTLANPVFHVSERVGDGARTKLVNNLLAAINWVGASEVMNLALRAGLNPQTTLQVIASSSGQSWIGSDRMPRALQADWAPRAHLSLLTKDSRLAVEMAQALDQSTPLGALAKQAFAQASAAGWAGFDDAAMLAHLRGELPPS